MADIFFVEHEENWEEYIRLTKQPHGALIEIGDIDELVCANLSYSELMNLRDNINNFLISRSLA